MRRRIGGASLAASRRAISSSSAVAGRCGGGLLSATPLLLSSSRQGNAPPPAGNTTTTCAAAGRQQQQANARRTEGDEDEDFDEDYDEDDADDVGTTTAAAAPSLPKNNTVASSSSSPEVTQQQFHTIVMQHREALAALARRTADLQKRVEATESHSTSRQALLLNLRAQLERLVADRRSTRLLMRQCLLEIQFLSARTMVLGTHVAKMDRDLNAALMLGENEAYLPFSPFISTANGGDGGESNSVSSVSGSSRRKGGASSASSEGDAHLTPELKEKKDLINARYQEKLAALLPLLSHAGPKVRAAQRGAGGDGVGGGGSDYYNPTSPHASASNTTSAYEDARRQGRETNSEAFNRRGSGGSSASLMGVVGGAQLGGSDRSAPVGLLSQHVSGGELDNKLASGSGRSSPVGDASRFCPHGLITGEVIDGAVERRRSAMQPQVDAIIARERQLDAEAEAALRLAAEEEEGDSVGMGAAQHRHFADEKAAIAAQAVAKHRKMFPLLYLSDVGGGYSGEGGRPSAPASQQSSQPATLNFYPSASPYAVPPMLTSDEVYRVAFSGSMELMEAIERHKRALKDPEQRLLKAAADSVKGGGGGGGGGLGGSASSSLKTNSTNARTVKDAAFDRLRRLAGELRQDDADDAKSYAGSSSSNKTTADPKRNLLEGIDMQQASRDAIDPANDIAKKLHILGDVYRQLQHEDATLLSSIRRKLKRQFVHEKRHAMAIAKAKDAVGVFQATAPAAPSGHRSASGVSPQQQQQNANASTTSSTSTTPNADLQRAYHRRHAVSRRRAAKVRSVYSKRFAALLSRREEMIGALEGVLRAQLLGSSPPQHQQQSRHSEGGGHPFASVVPPSLPAEALTDDVIAKTTDAFAKISPLAMGVNMAEAYGHVIDSLGGEATAGGGRRGGKKSPSMSPPPVPTGNGSNSARMLSDDDARRYVTLQQEEMAGKAWQRLHGSDQRLMEVIAPAFQYGGAVSPLHNKKISSSDAPEDGDASAEAKGSADAAAAVEEEVEAFRKEDLPLRPEGKLAPAYFEQALKGEAMAEVEAELEKRNSTDGESKKEKTSPHATNAAPLPTTTADGTAPKKVAEVVVKERGDGAEEAVTSPRPASSSTAAAAVVVDRPVKGDEGIAVVTKRSGAPSSARSGRGDGRSAVALPSAPAPSPSRYLIIYNVPKRVTVNILRIVLSLRLVPPPSAQPPKRVGKFFYENTLMPRTISQTGIIPLEESHESQCRRQLRSAMAKDNGGTNHHHHDKNAMPSVDLSLPDDPIDVDMRFNRFLLSFKSTSEAEAFMKAFNNTFIVDERGRVVSPSAGAVGDYADYSGDNGHVSGGGGDRNTRGGRSSLDAILDKGDANDHNGVVQPFAIKLGWVRR